MMASLRKDGVPADIPWFMTEYGYSVFGGRPEVDIEGALFNADTVGAFLSLGGAKPYLYGYEPNSSPGRAQMFLGQSHDASAKSQEQSTEPSLRLLCHSAPHERMDATDKRAARNISGHPKRNKERRAQSTAPCRNCVCSATTGQAVGPTRNQQKSQRAAQLKVQFNLPGAKQPLSFVGQVQVIQFSRAQYTWRDDGPKGHPIRSLPPAQFTREASASYELPPYSLTVLRGKVED